MSSYFDHLTSCLNGMIVWLNGWAKSVKQTHLEDDAETVKITTILCANANTLFPVIICHNMELNNPDDINFHSETESRRKHAQHLCLNFSQYLQH